MSRQNNYAATIQREARRISSYYIKYTKQICQDAAVIAINDAYGIGAGRIGEFLLEYVDNVEAIFSEIFSELDDIAKNKENDKKPVAAMRRIDRRVQQVLGPLFLKFEYRYGLETVPEELAKEYEEAATKIINGRRERLAEKEKNK